jgi:hypothetical protein
MDPDSSIFINDLQDANKKEFKKNCSCILLFEGTFTSFFKDKKLKRSHNTVEIKVFLTIFCLMIEESGSRRPGLGGSAFGSGSATLPKIALENTLLKVIFVRASIAIKKKEEKV